MPKLAEYVAGLLVFSFSICLYGSPSLLEGNFVYDDAGSVTGNGIVQMTQPLSELWNLDYWGTPLADFSSHKSWRPLTTWTFYVNNKLWGNSPYSFHLTNALMHALTSMLVVPTVLLAVPNSSLWFAFMTAVLFSSHPVHVEAVQNINGRADVLGSLFYLLGFVVYAKLVSMHTTKSSEPSNDGQEEKETLQWFRTFITSLFVFTLPLIFFTFLGMLSKETSITLPVLCVLWDFAMCSELSLVTFVKERRNKEKSKMCRYVKYKVKLFYEVVSNQGNKRILFFKWLIRTSLIGLSTVGLALFRSYKNGNNAVPKLTLNQNRISLQVCDNLYMKLWQLLSIFYLWYEYVKTMIFPQSLSADWSGRHFPPLYENENVTRLYERNFEDNPNQLQKENFNLDQVDVSFSTSNSYSGSSSEGDKSSSFSSSALQYHSFRYGRGFKDERLPITFLFVWCVIALLFEAMKSSGVIGYASTNQKTTSEAKEDGSGSKIGRIKTHSDDDDNGVVEVESKEEEIKGFLKEANSTTKGGDGVPFVSFLFLFVPFVLSSNMFVSVGTTKAERLMYLPVLGYCILVGYVLSDSAPAENKQTSLRSSSGNKTQSLNIVNSQSAKELESSMQSIANAMTGPKSSSTSSISSFLAVFMKRLVFVLTVVAYSKRSFMRAKEWNSTLTLWESAYRTGNSLGYVSAHTLQNYGLALQWQGDFESANRVFEEYDRLGNEELEDLKFNVEVYHALGLRMIGKLNKAKTKMTLTLRRLEELIVQKELENKDASGQKNKKARVMRVLAIIVSHESLTAAAMLLQRAGSSGDHFTLRCVEEMDKAFKEIETFSQSLIDSDAIQKPLSAMPYPFKGYDDLPGNSELLASKLAPSFIFIRDGGHGHVTLIGGGSGGTLRNLLSR